MNDTELKKSLMAAAREKGICQDGYTEMRTLSLGSLIGYYTAHPDWCISRDYPDIRTLRENFSDCEEYGIFVDREFRGETLSGRQVYVFHHCRGTVNVEMDYRKAIIPMLYFANGCDISLRCKQKNRPPIKVPVYVLDEPDNNVGCEDSEDCVFVRYDIIKKTRPC